MFKCLIWEIRIDYALQFVWFLEWKWANYY